VTIESPQILDILFPFLSPGFGLWLSLFWYGR